MPTLLELADCFILSTDTIAQLLKDALLPLLPHSLLLLLQKRVEIIVC